MQDAIVVYACARVQLCGWMCECVCHCVCQCLVCVNVCAIVYALCVCAGFAIDPKDFEVALVNAVEHAGFRIRYRNLRGPGVN